MAVQEADTSSRDAQWHHHEFHWRPYCRRSTYDSRDLDEALTGDPINATADQVRPA